MPEKIMHKNWSGPRPRSKGLVMMSVSVKPEQREKLLRLSYTRNVSISRLVREALDDYFQRLDEGGGRRGEGGSPGGDVPRDVSGGEGRGGDEL